MAAKEGEVAVAAEGVGGAFGYLGGRRSSSPCTHGGRGCWSDGPRHGLGAGEHALPASAGQ